MHFDLKYRKGFAIVELDCVESKRKAIASYKNPILCKSRVSIEKLSGDSFDFGFSSAPISNKSQELVDIAKTSTEKMSTNRANFVFERDFNFAGSRPVEISIDLDALPVKNVTFKRSRAQDDYFVEIVA